MAIRGIRGLCEMGALLYIQTISCGNMFFKLRIFETENWLSNWQSYLNIIE